jgi:hypothetical protein
MCWNWKLSWPGLGISDKPSGVRDGGRKTTPSRRALNRFGVSRLSRAWQQPGRRTRRAGNARTALGIPHMKNIMRTGPATAGKLERLVKYFKLIRSDIDVARLQDQKRSRQKQPHAHSPRCQRAHGFLVSA